jgi:hypothetical protein
MTEFIAVNDIFSIIEYGSLKRQALMFDRITMPNFRKTLDGLHERLPDRSDLFAEFDWLIEKGIVFGGDIDVDEEALKKDPEYQEFFNRYFNHLINMDQTFRGVNIADLVGSNTEGNELELTEKGRTAWESLSGLFGFQARELSLQLRLVKGFDAYPVLSSFISPMPMAQQEDKATVVQIVLQEFPVPDERTAWERIEEFRSDPDSRSKFFPLKQWISEVARMKLPRTEIEDNLRARISEYETQMRLHRIERKWDTLKIIAGVDIGFLAAADYRGWGPLITSAGIVISNFIAIKLQQVKLLQAEQQTPGKEIAYIVKAKETF